MAFIQGNPADRGLYLTLGNVPATGIAASSVVCNIKKEGANTLTPKALNSSNWIELGSGYYTIRFNSTDTDTVGEFFFELTSSSFDNFLYDEFSVEPPPPTPTFSAVQTNINVFSTPQYSVVDRNLYLSLGNSPSLGILTSDVTCQYKKQGQNSLSPKALDSTNWFELGDGFYTVRFTQADTNVVGTYFYTLLSDLFDGFLYDEFTVTAITTPAGFCTVTGSLSTIGATIPQNTQITFRPATFPLSVNNAIVTSDKVITYPDINGNFAVNLVQGSLVLVEIERTGLFFQITIPMTSTAELLSLLPPFPPQ